MLLGSQGWRRPYVLPRGHERFTHAITFQIPPRVEIDLHQHIAHRALGLRIATDEVLRNSVHFEIAGHTVLAPCRRDRLIHAAIHTMASRGRYRRLSSVADVLRLAESCVGEAESALQHSEQWRIRPLVAQAVIDAYETAQLPCPTPWISAVQRPAVHRDRLIERAYLGTGRRPIWEEVAYLRLMDGWLDRGRYVAGFFATGPEYSTKKRRSGPLSQSRYLWVANTIGQKASKVTRGL